MERIEMTEWQATAKALLIKAEEEVTSKADKNTLLSQAAETMAAIAIDEAAMAAAKEVEDSVKTENYRFASPYAAQKADIYRICARFNRCKFEKIKNESSVYEATGYEQDLNRADWMYRLFIDHGVKILEEIPAPYWENGRSFHILLWSSYADKLSALLQRAQIEAEENASSGNSRILKDRYKDVQRHKKAA